MGELREPNGKLGYWPETTDEILSPEVIDRLWSYVQRGSGCWPWTGSLISGGYGHMYVGRRMYLAHRLVWVIVHGTIPKGICVLHHCDNRKCCNPTHLFLGTSKDNSGDMMQKGRNGYTGNPREENPRAKLTNANVVAIKTALMNPYRGIQRDLAKQYGVNRQVITEIEWGRNWRSLLVEGWQTPNRKHLIESDVREIKLALLSPYYGIQAALARRYNTGDNAIGRISRGETWKHIS